MPSPHRANPSRLVFIGISLLLAGLAFNKWTLALASPDRRIENTLYIVFILTVQLLLIGSGITIIVFRRQPQRLRGWALNAALTAASLSLCHMGLEAILQVLPSGDRRYSLALYSEKVGGRLRMERHLDLVARVEKSDVAVRTNSLGMRWKEFDCEQAPIRERVAFVGDSFTFGEWADCIEHTFVGVFDSLVDRQRYEVLNFGVPSYGLLEIKTQIIEEILPLHPRFIYLMFFNGNDIADTFPEPVNDFETVIT